MPRMLPWALDKAGVKTKSRLSSKEPTPRQKTKHRALFLPSSDTEQRFEDEGDVSTSRGQRQRAMSSSPAGAPPEQIFMNEGLDQDDRYRMVEDEFLSIAKQFTQHLHAAEYKRMKKAAKTQNAAAINSISRPITMKMPDATKRKVEGVKRSKRQVSALQGMLGQQDKGPETDTESDGEEAAWVGTALHGLMDSPRKSAASLLKVGSITASTSTRAAAGFRKLRGVKEAVGRKKGITTPQHIPRSFSSEEDEIDQENVVDHESATESSDDDDLDGPLRHKTTIDRPKPKQPLFVRRNAPPSITAESDPPISDTADNKSSMKRQSVKLGKASSRFQTETEADSSRARIARRLEQVRSKRIKGNSEERKPDLNIIPTFL